MAGLQGKDLGALVGQIGADIREWEKAMQKVEADMARAERKADSAAKRMSKSFDDAGKKMQQIGKKMTMSITLPLATMGGLAVREFGNFDAAMNQSLAIMGDVSSMMEKQMSEAAREVGRTMSLSATEAAESFFFLASAGLDAEQSVAAMPKVAEFAQAGMFDMATATDLATDAQSALGLTVEDTEQNIDNLTRVTDTLVGANTLANATVEQFATSLTREAGAALKNFNKDIEEGVAVLAVFADQGIKGERAGAGLGRVIRLLTKAALNNKEAMEELGIEVFDSNGKMRNLADIVEDLEVAFDGMSDEQRGASLEAIGFTARVQQMILPLIGASNQIREYESNLRDMGGITKEVSDKQMNTFNEQLSLLVDNIKDVGIEFGETMVPALEKLVKWAQNAVQAFQNMEEEMKAKIVAIAALLGAGGPLLIALGVAARAIAGFVRFARTKFGLIIISLGGIAAAGQWLADNWETIGNRIKREMQSWVDVYEDSSKSLAVKTAVFLSQFMPGWTGVMGRATNEVMKLNQGLEKGETELTSYSDAVQKMMGKIGKMALEFSGADDSLAQFLSLLEEGAGASGPSVDGGTGIQGLASSLVNASVATGQLTARTIEYVEGGQRVKSVADLMLDVGLALEEGIKKQKNMAKASKFAMSVAHDFTASFGQGLTNVIVQGEKLIDVLENIGKLLLSSVIQKGISVLLTGGLGGTGFFGSGGGLFGKIFGMQNDALVTSEGAVVPFHKDDDILAMKNLGDLNTGGGGMGGTVVFKIGRDELVGVLREGGDDEVAIRGKVNPLNI